MRRDLKTHMEALATLHTPLNIRGLHENLEKNDKNTIKVNYERINLLDWF